MGCEHLELTEKSNRCKVARPGDYEGEHCQGYVEDDYCRRWWREEARLANEDAGDLASRSTVMCRVECRQGRKWGWACDECRVRKALAAHEARLSARKEAEGE